MKVLITGGAGYIGSHVALHFLDQGHSVTIIDNLSTGNKKLIPKKAKFIKADISNEKKISNIFKKKFDIVLHFAAYVNNVESIKNSKKYYLNNFEKSKNFIDCCIKNNIKYFIYSSTAAVYGNSLKKVKERSKKKALTPYAKSKMRTENYLLNKKKKMNFTILRYFNVCGADKSLRSGFSKKNLSNIFVKLCYCAKYKKKFIINGSNYDTSDGTPVRDFIHVSDLAILHYKFSNLMIHQNKSGIFNCGYGKGYSVKNIFDIFNKNLTHKISYKIGSKRKNDIIYSVADIKKLKNSIKWRPKYFSLNKICKSSLKWYLNNN